MRPTHVQPLLDLLTHMGATIRQQPDAIHIAMTGRPTANLLLDTGPYPQFPTDLQAQLMVLLAVSEGHSRIREQVFERRFQHVPALQNMHATIFLQGDSAHIHGVRRLYGTEVAATDLRAGAALVLAGLVASGTTTISDVHHIDRGYARMDEAYRALGASILRVDTDEQADVDISASIS
jgi:UDP-N-acetylglucosamine 1-carboxyvinyltransferase